MSKYEGEAPAQKKHNPIFRALDWSTGFLKRKKDKERAAQERRLTA